MQAKRKAADRLMQAKRKSADRLMCAIVDNVFI